jgi:hypothetical protein
MGEIGKILTITVTLPILTLLFFGPVALILAVPIALLALVGRRHGSGRS